MDSQKETMFVSPLNSDGGVAISLTATRKFTNQEHAVFRKHLQYNVHNTYLQGILKTPFLWRSIITTLG